MIRIDIISGFLGAGKTTLIRKLIGEAYGNEKVVLIENEFGEIGVDGGFLKDAGVEITEMNSGCICCSLVGDFAKALQEVATRFSPDRIVIEPSGVGKLSDVIRAVQRANVKNAQINAFCTVVDAKKCKLYLKNFGEFFLDQVENASCIVLSHTADAAKTQEAERLLRKHTKATIVTTDWAQLSGAELLSAMEQKDSLAAELLKLAKEQEEEHHHHDGECECHHHHDDEEHECHHHHDDEEHECHHHHDDEEHECHHHHDDEEHECHHHHHHDEEHECHHHHDEEEHEGHHHHHADEVFQSWGIETAKVYSEEELNRLLETLAGGEYGQILRAKGIVNGKDHWIYFDYVPGEVDIRTGAPAVTGRLCVIGCGLKEEKLSELFLN